MSEFKLQLLYSIDFQTNPFGKGMNVAYIYILDTYRRNDNRRMTNDRRMKKGRKKTSLATYSPLTLLQGFERVVEGLHVRGCWRLNVNFIFWPHCYDRHVVSCSPDVGVHSIRAFRGPPRSGVTFPYHSWSLLSGIILATALGVSEVPRSRVWPSLQHLVSNPLGVCWQLLWHPKLNWVK